ncbi:MAG TPA: hypothetical protein VLM36_09395, partial [Sphingomicrobium sp.]|nr:hypothetical protein [Sphingomicrobium sp.]
MAGTLGSVFGIVIALLMFEHLPRLFDIVRLSGRTAVSLSISAAISSLNWQTASASIARPGKRCPSPDSSLSQAARPRVLPLHRRTSARWNRC